LAAEPAPAPRRPARDSRTPSPAGAVVSRKSSFCSLFKSRETIASPESPSDALRRKKSLNEGRSRSRSRDRSATPTSATKIKGSVLSLFKTPRKSATSPSPSSREGSPVVQAPRPAVPQAPRPTRGEKLKYYEDAKDGIIHIPLRTPPDEAGAPSGDHDVRPASAPQQRGPPSSVVTSAAVPSSSAGSSVAAGPASSSVHAARSPSKPIQRTVLPDGSIIIPLRSPTEKNAEDDLLATFPVKSKTPEEPRPTEKTSRSSSTVEVVSAVISPEPVSTSSGPASASPGDAATGPSAPDVTPSPDPPPPVAPTERARSRRERLIFTTHVGSAEQVFCTQFSITKTPSVTSEISGSFPSFPDVEEAVAAASTSQVTLASTSTVALELHTPAAESHTPVSPGAETPRGGPAPSPGGASPQDAGRDSSESEASSEAAPARAGNDVERRGLVVQESFEDELPYVPTTLPQERSLALPMVPVRERGGVRVAAVQRPRAT
ncbi:leucine-rich repeat extensin-like protein 5, partial [Ostrinia furnacalis]|uniref:leucine-rich repeat extensin-like protein 5 n=1 Tax=Ostrinia furnacalis TaxID=93504 RepID=UPI00103E3847